MSSSPNPYSSPQSDEVGDLSDRSDRPLIDTAVYGMFCGGMLGATAGALSLGVLAIVWGIVDAGPWGWDALSSWEQVVRYFTCGVVLGCSGGCGSGAVIGAATGLAFRYSDSGTWSYVRCVTTAVWTCVGLAWGLWLGWTNSGHGVLLRWVGPVVGGLLCAVTAGGTGWLCSMSLSRQAAPAPERSDNELSRESDPPT